MSTKIFAHRGASKYAPENTMAAFRLAELMQADGIETDVQLTKDQVPVIIHDETINRTTNKRGLVRNLTYEELRQTDAGAWFSRDYAGEKIISLDVFLQWIKKTPMLLNLELKTNKFPYPGIEKIVLQCLTYHGMKDRTTISSFNTDTILRFSALDNEIDTGFLTSRRPRQLFSLMEEIGAKALHPKYRLLNKKLIQDCLQHQVPIRVYTVNQPVYILRALEANCDVIISDVPDRALELQKGYITS
ncbi:glycerophosphodiester phosphodiesterase [Terribacillus saccharophilus]|uniref:Glycerophosphodiester phosphodiesterase n=1 Tax=Terribacillus saccharophilus TaxID=361277 RepID=A0ABX4H236_9BACI|nr:glycerophosphodiester phosphodiesterase [Terribacillus saccharophilus]PAD36837.1 glycerophosphodiester phosphodiesterase [Terribacillus saccharophilus]PAD97820.1 glycerophosphodiester phosphodiesterase [Terribacillus saccharophilus]PAE01202.1 glycerophosphodiester phosphodiesterase [Terribacillus saccharophilus]